MSNILKRKNEDDTEVSENEQLNKRVALDSEHVEEADKPEISEKTAPQTDAPSSPEPAKEAVSEPADKTEPSKSPELAAGVEGVQYENANYSQNAYASNPSNDLYSRGNSHSSGSGPYGTYLPGNTGAYVPEQGHNGPNGNGFIGPKPVVNHRERDDPDHVSVRMLASVKEAGIIVGKKGEKITHIREKANVRIYVSENLKNVPERVISVRGSAENVARAFGLLTRTILDEPEDEPASMMSRQYVLQLLVPHAIVGYVIGKQGSKFREIEENSAAKLKAAEQPLAHSTDRVLTVLGVGDAIHIALYYICQVLIEHRDSLKKNKVVFYNPANYQQPPSQHSSPPYSQHSQPPYSQQQPYSHSSQPMGGMAGGPSGNMPYMAAGPMHVQGSAPGMPGMPPMDMPQQSYALPQQHKPYDFQAMFQPAVRPQYSAPNMAPAPAPPSAMPPQSSYTDEHGNTIVGDVITNPPVQIGSGPDRFTQDVFVANQNIGSVIGKGGHNIKQIRESSGCAYVKIEPDQHQSILLGGGRGLTSIRKLTLTGAFPAIQSAIYLINQRIGQDKERNGVQ